MAAIRPQSGSRSGRYRKNGSNALAPWQGWPRRSSARLGVSRTDSRKGDLGARWAASSSQALSRALSASRLADDAIEQPRRQRTSATRFSVGRAVANNTSPA